MSRTILLSAAAMALAACGNSGTSPDGAPPSQSAQENQSAQAPQGGEAPQGAETPPPNPERDPATRAPTADLPDDYLLHPWAAKGGDCQLPDFHITENTAGGLVVETRLNGSPATGRVDRAGPGGANASFVFENSEFPIERRGVDGLAVLAPTRAPDRPGAMRIAGQAIAGDGVVFIQCPE